MLAKATATVAKVFILCPLLVVREGVSQNKWAGSLVSEYKVKQECFQVSVECVCRSQ